MKNTIILYLHLIEEKYFYIFLSKNQNLLYKKRLKKQKGEAEFILKLIDEVLNKKAINLKDLSSLAVTLGKGSFTSTRIAAVTANTISYCMKVPLIQIEITELKEKKQISLNELIQKAFTKYQNKHFLKIIDPLYSAKPNITLKK